jgi:hypothetical protein
LSDINAGRGLGWRAVRFRCPCAQARRAWSHADLAGLKAEVAANQELMPVLGPLMAPTG